MQSSTVSAIGLFILNAPRSVKRSGGGGMVRQNAIDNLKLRHLSELGISKDAPTNRVVVPSARSSKTQPVPDDSSRLLSPPPFLGFQNQPKHRKGI